MKKITLSLTLMFAMYFCRQTVAQTLPKFDHVIVVLEENYAYSDIIGSSYAPTFTALSKDSTTASFSQAYAITHPSEPNYLDLFSGSNQGVTTDETGPDANAPFNDCNLGAAIIAAGKTFIGYSEEQPSDGWIAGDVNEYVTKHCPWINWQGGTSYVFPDSSDLMMTMMPDSNHYSKLPTMCWIIPDLVDDMHDPYNPATAIPNGDTWFKVHIMPMVRWAVTHNSLVITVWDEDDQLHSNNIPCLFSGANIKGGSYSSPKFNHYNLLRTMEDFYGATPLCGSASTATDITGPFWRTTGVNTVEAPENEINVWPVPAQQQLNMNVTSTTEGKAVVSIHDMTGREIISAEENIKPGANYLSFNIAGFASGVYFVNVTGTNINLCKKVVIQN